MIQLVRILFPGAGLLVLSAWCLGVLNSHRKFFLSYTAPVVWNIAIIVSLVMFGGLHPGQLNANALNQFQFHLAVLVAWGSVVGSALQFGVQLPDQTEQASDATVDDPSVTTWGDSLSNRQWDMTQIHAPEA